MLLGLIPAMVICSLIGSTAWVVNMQKFDGQNINLAGRQRMLSQKMFKELLVSLQATDKNKKQAIAQTQMTMDVFAQTLSALRNGGKAPKQFILNDKTTFVQCPPAHDKVLEQLNEVTDLWTHFQKTMKPMLHGKAILNDTQLSLALTQNLDLLKQMNKAVGLMQQEAEKKTAMLMKVQGIGFGICLLGVVFTIWVSTSLNRLLKDTVDTLTNRSHEVTQAAGQISQTSQALASSVTDQAASIEEITATLQEMTQRTNQNSKQLTESCDHSKKTLNNVEDGNASIKHLSTAMEQIKTSANQTASIIKTIEEIAFRTNLLALNAAVEAARAGEEGVGFAVVADEVRSLARRSSEAAKETSDLIREAVQNAERGVVINGEVVESLDKISHSAQCVSQITEQVTSTDFDQKKGMGQMLLAIDQLNNLAQQNAANSEEEAAVSETLNSQANEVQDVVNKLKTLVGN